MTLRSLAFVLFLLPSACLADETFVVTPGERQLFLDDQGIARMEGLTRVMHQPTKRGPVLKPDIPSDGSMIQIRSAPMWDPEQKIYKLVYAAQPMDDHRLVGMALATSKDGLHWEKPDLGQRIEIRGSTRNNRIAVEHKPGVRHLDFTFAIYDPDDPDPKRRFKALMGDDHRVPVAGPDGIHWNRLEAARIPSGDESSVTYDRARHRFLALVKTGNKFGRAHNLGISTDFVNWKLQYCFGADDEDQPLALKVIRQRVADRGLASPVFVDPDPALGLPKRPGPPTWRAECYYITVFPYEGLYIGMPSMFYPTGVDANGTNCDGFDLIQLAATRDLVHWRRLGDREPFIPPGRIDNGLVGVWDRVQMFATNPVPHGDELWIYYSALKWRDDPYQVNSDRSRRDPKTLAPEERADQAEGGGAVCLAVLRRDGFVSLSAGEQPGVMTTKPFTWTGGKLLANVETKEDGALRVEVLSEADQVLAASHPLVGNHTRGTFRWTSDSSGSLKGKQVRLRFTSRKANFYAYWLVP